MAAYLITFTCYGQYIPGQQGAIDRDHNMAGSRLPAPRPKLRQHVESLLKQAPYQMDAVQRDIVLQATEEVCHYRSWPLLAAHGRSNHVHTVVDADVAPEVVMNAFKSDASRALDLHVPGHPERLRWARHGSTRYLWSFDKVDAAVRYVLEKQGEPMAWYSAPERAASVRFLTVAVRWRSQPSFHFLVAHERPARCGLLRLRRQHFIPIRRVVDK